MENTNLKPVIRFPEFTENWQETKFKNHFEFKNTNSLSRDKLNYESGSVKNIHYGDIHTKFNTHFDIEKEELPFINEDVDISRVDKENYVLEGDIVMADASEDYADIGKSIEVTKTNNEKILAGLHTFLARQTDKTVAKGFFGHILTTYNARIELMTIAQGTKVLGLSKGRVENINLYIPKPSEQEKISNSLTTVDNRIALLKEKKDTLLNFKKGVMQKIFNKEIRFKDDSGNDFKDWNEKKLGVVGNTINGLTGKTKEDFGSGKPFIQYTQIFNSSKVNTNDFGLVNIGKNDNQTKVQFGDILFTTSSETPHEVGMSSVLLEEIDELYLNSFSFGFRPNNLKELVPSFAQYLFRSNNVRRNIIKLAQGSTRYNMSKLSFMKQTILLPEEDEQIKIASYLSVLDDKIEGIQQKIDASVDFKKSLLQKMFV